MIGELSQEGTRVDKLTSGSNKFVLRICDNCAKEDWIKYHKIRNSRNVNGYENDYCKKCSYQFRPNKGGPVRDPNGKTDDKGYRCYYIGNKKYLAHRMAAELMLRRKLKDDEVVHHIDGNKINNEWSNLLVCSAEEHARLHAQLEALAMTAVRAGIFIFKSGRYHLNPENLW